MGPQEVVFVNWDYGYPVGVVFNEIMDGRAKVSDHNPNGSGHNMVQVNETDQKGWFVRYGGHATRSGKDEFSENLREFIRKHEVCSVSYFVEDEFASMIKENNTSPLKKTQAMKARRIVREIIDLQCQEVPMTKSANKR